MKESLNLFTNLSDYSSLAPAGKIATPAASLMLGELLREKANVWPGTEVVSIGFLYFRRSKGGGALFSALEVLPGG